MTPDDLATENKRLRAKIGRLRRSLRQLNKAHIVLWKVIGLYMDRVAKPKVEP